MHGQQKPECVMVVEHDSLAAQDIALRIVKLGYGIAGIMSSGEEALQKIGQLKPDLILLDLLIAGSMDGIETAGHIQLTTNIPVILLTSCTDHELVTRALPGSPFAYLQMPLDERELELKLELTLLRHRMEVQSRITRQALERRIAEITQALDATHQTLQKLQNKQHRNQISLQRFSNALDDSADSIYLIDRVSMRFIDVNQTACERSGYSRDEMLEMGPHDIKPYLNRQALEQHFDKIAATQDRFGILETCHKCKNNEIYPVEVRLRASESDGRAIMVAIARDMTLRCQNERALRLSEEKFRMLFESSPIGLALMTSDYRFAEVNAAFSDMLGYRRDELNGKSMDTVTHPDDRNTSLEIAENLFSGAAPGCSIEKKYLHKNGDPVWARLHGTIIRDQDRQPLFGLGMIENIDHVKRAEALRLAQEAAQKKALVREVHHRIKNHLQGVMGLMRQHVQDSSPCNGIIEKAIAQINAVATIHGLQGKESGEDVDLLQMLAAIRQEVMKLIPACFFSPVEVAGNISLHLNRDESVPIALALNELMVNAAKHGASPMEISLERRSDHAVIRIENRRCRALEKIDHGSGLELVHALLQTGGVAFRYEHDEQRFLAEIILSPPVVDVYKEG